MRGIVKRVEKAQADRAQQEERAKAVQEKAEQFAANIEVGNTPVIFQALEKHKAEHGSNDLDFATVSICLSVFAELLKKNRLLANNASVNFFVEAARVGVSRAAVAAKKRAEDKRIITV